jgi:hypothetical protein
MNSELTTRRQGASKRLFFFVVLVGALGACSSWSKGSEGVASPQAPDTNQCLELDAQCTQDDACCSLWCANGECAPKDP